jgi:hypothetical protein
MNAIVANGRERRLIGASTELEQRALEWFAIELNHGHWWRRRIVLWQLRRKLAAIVRRKEPSSWTMW